MSLLGRKPWHRRDPASHVVGAGACGTLIELEEALAKARENGAPDNASIQFRGDRRFQYPDYLHVTWTEGGR